MGQNNKAIHEAGFQIHHDKIQVHLHTNFSNITSNSFMKKVAPTQTQIKSH